MFQQMQSMAQKQVLKLFLPMSAYSYTYIYNYYYSLSTYICITTTLIDDMLLSRSSNVYVHIMYRSSIARPLYTHLATQRCACTRILRNGIDILIFSLYHLVLLSLFCFLFLKVAAQCCDVVCLQVESYYHCAAIGFSSLAPCHLTLQNHPPPPPPAAAAAATVPLDPAYDNSRRARVIVIP